MPSRSTIFLIYAYLAYFISFEPFLASFCNFFEPVGQLVHHSHLEKGPTWSSRMPLVVFQPCSTPGLICGAHNYIFSIFGPLFGPLWAIFGTFWVWQMGQNGQPWCPWHCFNLVPTYSTNKLISDAYLAYYIIVWPTFASFCHFWSMLDNFFTMFTWKTSPNMVLPDASCWVSTLYHPFQTKVGPLGWFVWLTVANKFNCDKNLVSLKHASVMVFTCWLAMQPLQDISETYRITLSR